MSQVNAMSLVPCRRARYLFRAGPVLGLAAQKRGYMFVARLANTLWTPNDAMEGGLHHRLHRSFLRLSRPGCLPGRSQWAPGQNGAPQLRCKVRGRPHICNILERHDHLRACQLHP